MSDLFLLDGLLLALNAFKQLMEGIRKLFHAFILELLGHLIVVDANFLKSVKFRISLRNVVLDAKAHSTVIAEVLNSFQRHRIHGVWADEFLCVQHIAIGRVLGTCTGPQRSLYMSAILLEFLEARLIEDALELLVDDTGISNGGLAFE